MIYICNETVSVNDLADLRESVGWNRMEKEYKNPLLTSYYHIAVYEKEALIGYIDCVLTVLLMRIYKTCWFVLIIKAEG